MYPKLAVGLNLPLILERYITREITFTWVGTILVLLLIFSGQQSVRMLNRVVSGQLDGAMLADLIGLTLLSNLGILLPFALYLAILLAIGRLYRDSEMAALGACGVGEPRVARIVGGYALAVTLVSLVWALWGEPRAEAAFERTWETASETTGVGGLQPATFNEFSMGGGRAVVYAESVDGHTGALTGVFIRAPHPEAEGERVVVAERGRQFTDAASGRRYLLLEEGHQYQGRPGAADYRIIDFQRYRVHLPELEVAESRRLRAQSTGELLRSGDPEKMAEFHWRLAIPLSTLPLALLAVPLARTSPRQGRYARLFAALLIFILYSNLMGIAREWVDDQVVPPAIGLWWVHALALSVAGALLLGGTRLPRPRRPRSAP